MHRGSVAPIQNTLEVFLCGLVCHSAVPSMSSRCWKCSLGSVWCVFASPVSRSWIRIDYAVGVSRRTFTCTYVCCLQFLFFFLRLSFLSLSFSYCSRTSDSGSHTHGRQSLLPPPYYGLCFQWLFDRGKTWAISSFVDLRRMSPTVVQQYSSTVPLSSWFLIYFWTQIKSHPGGGIWTHAINSRSIQGFRWATESITSLYLPNFISTPSVRPDFFSLERYTCYTYIIILMCIREESTARHIIAKKRIT